MRDILLIALVFGALPFVLTRPYLGVLLWYWIGLMNPHRLTWSFAYDFPFAQWIAIVTLFAVFISREDRRIAWSPAVVTLLAYCVWVTVTTSFAYDPDWSWIQWKKVMKIQLMVFVTLMIMKSKQRINMLVWVVTLSLGFYGVKGGLFTLLTGGQHHVIGPGGFIGGNTSLALALIMTMPLMWYLRIQSGNLWVRHGMTAAMALTAVAVIGTYSRGAFLAIIAIAVFLWFKSPKKGVLTLLLVIAIPFVVSFMPEKWFDRMETIQTYEQDRSAMGRIDAWSFALNLAKEHPLVGGGFQAFRPELFAIYGSDPSQSRDAHSIYFEVLGEHGFVGLFLFLLLMWLAWRSGSWILRNAKTHHDLKWAADLAAMLQVSLVGYAVAGAFLGLAYFDLYYVLVALFILTREYVASAIVKDRSKASLDTEVSVQSPVGNTAGNSRSAH